MVTRRVRDRLFLLKPTVLSKQVVEYCVHRAAATYGVEVHALQVLDNHYHAVVTDPQGKLPLFMGWVDREIAKCMNEHYGRAENFWSSDHYSAVRLVDAEAVVGKCVYTFVNVVKALLVRDFRDWHGVRSTPRDWTGPGRTVKRPDVHFDQKDVRWAEVSVRYTVPPALRDRPAELTVADMELAIDRRQREIRAQARRDGKAFVGVARLEKLSPFDSPKSKRVKGKLSPTFAAGTTEARQRARKERASFLTVYREALHKWCQGLPHLFPFGAYWLPNFASA